MHWAIVSVRTVTIPSTRGLQGKQMQRGLASRKERASSLIYSCIYSIQRRTASSNVRRIATSCSGAESIAPAILCSDTLYIQPNTPPPKQPSPNPPKAIPHMRRKRNPATMPLVVPGLMTASDTRNPQEDWTNKLVGKKITDGASDEMVRMFTFDRSGMV